MNLPKIIEKQSDITTPEIHGKDHLLMILPAVKKIAQLKDTPLLDILQARMERRGVKLEELKKAFETWNAEKSSAPHIAQTPPPAPPPADKPKSA